MLKKRWFAGAALVVVLAMALSSCDSDSPSGPGTPGTGTGTKIQAGLYDIVLKQWTCGMTDTMMEMFEGIQCVDFSFDELFELPCPVNISNNQFSIDCTDTESDDVCTYTERIQATGTLTGNTWTINATVNISNEVPTGCSQEAACGQVMVTVTRTGGTPTACNYAPANTVETTISGGPFEGNTPMQAQGSSTNVGGVYSWGIFAVASSSAKAERSGDRIANAAQFNMNLSDLDPESLPATFDITVIGEGQAALPAGTASYFDQTTSGTFFFATDGSGSVTVNEVSDTHIAGRINSLTINGSESTLGGAPMQSQRTLSGGFYIQEGGIPTTKVQLEEGWLGRILRN